MIIFYLIILSLLPITMIAFGRAWRKSSSTTINYVFEYRTSRSMINQDTWEFAHMYFGKLWYILGLIEIIPSYISLFIFRNSNNDTLGNVIICITIFQLVLLIIPIIPTEIALKKTFDRYGNRN